MAIEYAGDPTYHPNVTVVDDSDPPTAASFAAGLQDCADREAYLKGRADAYDASNTQLNLVCPGYSSSGYTMLFGPADVVGADAASSATGILRLWTGGATAYDYVTLQADLPVGSRVAQIGAYITGAHWGSLPAQGNTITIGYYDLATGTTTVLDTFIDTPADVATMNSRRSIGHVLATPFTVDSFKQYFITIQGATGGSNDGAVNRTNIAHAAFVVVKK